MNWANRLTVARFFLTLSFVVTLSVKWPFSYTISLVLFLLAGITDYVDGEVARRFSMITNFGKLMDPLVDKIMIVAAFICLAMESPIQTPLPAWAIVIIISREFLITGLRLLALSNGKVLAAESLGKHKTAWQIATVIYFLALLSLTEISRWRGSAVPSWFWKAWSNGGPVLVLITIALTLVSGVGYLWKNRVLIEVK